MDRNRELEKYSKDEPIFVYLRSSKKKNLKAYLDLLFYFGEMDENDIDSHGYGQSVSWYVEKRHVNMIKDGFKIVCTDYVFEEITNQNNMIRFRIHWKENEMNLVVLNKIIFPYFSDVPKEYLQF